MTNSNGFVHNPASIMRSIDPAVMLVQIGRYGTSHPPAERPFDYTRAVLSSLLWDEKEAEEYIKAARELGAVDDKSLVLDVLQPLSRAIREATDRTVAELSARK